MRLTNAVADKNAGRTPTIDDLFRAAVALRPNVTALVDPLDRMEIDSVAPRRLSYREADHAVSAIANRLRELALPADSVVALKLPNTVENALSLLGVIRAGFIPAVIPSLWRRADTVAAFARISPRVLVTSGDLEEAMHAAAETFSVRYVCAFGPDVPDGIVPLDAVFAAGPAQVSPPPRGDSPEDHVALVTFDLMPDGLVPVARTHRQVIEAAQHLFVAAGHAQGMRLLMSMALASFSTFAVSLMAALLSGGTLVLQQDFSPQVMAAQMAQNDCDTVVVPGAIASRIVDSGLLGDRRPRLIALWRSPERVFQSIAAGASPGQFDLAAFGEIACLPVQRDADGNVLPILPGVVFSGGGGVPILVVGRTPEGTFAASGGLVPIHAFPPGERADQPRMKVNEHGWADTEYACRLDRETKRLLIDAPPPGLVSVGGCRFRTKDLQALAERLDNGAHIAALPDAIAGHRLAGVGAPGAGVRDALAALGIHPLLAAAFRDRRKEEHATAA